MLTLVNNNYHHLPAWKQAVQEAAALLEILVQSTAALSCLSKTMIETILVPVIQTAARLGIAVRFGPRTDVWSTNKGQTLNANFTSQLSKQLLLVQQKPPSILMAHHHPLSYSPAPPASMAAPLLRATTLPAPPLPSAATMPLLWHHRPQMAMPPPTLLPVPVLPAPAPPPPPLKPAIMDRYKPPAEGYAGRNDNMASRSMAATNNNNKRKKIGGRGRRGADDVKPRCRRRCVRCVQNNGRHADLCNGRFQGQQGCQYFTQDGGYRRTIEC